jgi:hypothetical protein
MISIRLDMAQAPPAIVGERLLKTRPSILLWPNCVQNSRHSTHKEKQETVENVNPTTSLVAATFEKGKYLSFAGMVIHNPKVGPKLKHRSISIPTPIMPKKKGRGWAVSGRSQPDA